MLHVWRLLNYSDLARKSERPQSDRTTERGMFEMITTNRIRNISGVTSGFLYEKIKDFKSLGYLRPHRRIVSRDVSSTVILESE